MSLSPPSLPPVAAVAPSASHHCRAIPLSPSQPRHLPPPSVVAISLPSSPPQLSPSSTVVASAEIARASLIGGFHREQVCRSEKVWRSKRKRLLENCRI
ncbi:unnamed protein product [Linum trigynum]|uniref:Uncharacterized protein n=1 Tax=Linum trigynum TaxID=586398 RepID=A0AAV2G5B2_9ROSI